MVDRPDPAPDSEPAPARRVRPRKRFRTAVEARQWRRRIIGYALGTITFVLVVNALVGENGYLATLRANRETQELEATLRQIREENQQLQDRIHRMRSDPTALEEAARGELRMGKPGETMVVIKDAEKPKAPAAPPK